MIQLPTFDELKTIEFTQELLVKWGFYSEIMTPETPKLMREGVNRVLENPFVGYYFKPQTDYPARIYKYYRHGMSMDRHLQSKGLRAAAFHTRRMTVDEILDECTKFRVRFKDFEAWDKLIDNEIAEWVEADEILKLLEYRKDYELPKTKPFAFDFMHLKVVLK